MSFIREHIIKRATRSSGWSKVRKDHIKRFPVCAACGTKRKLEVHHIKDFSSNPELELDPDNLITLCRSGTQCHLTFGHLGSWKSINLEAVSDSTWFKEKVKKRR
jgi:5-methylcytosine-specific restriction protein A